MIKFRYVYSNGKEIKTFIYTIEEIETMEVVPLWLNGLGENPRFKLISRDRFTDRTDKNGDEIFENDNVTFPTSLNIFYKMNERHNDKEVVSKIYFKDGMFTFDWQYGWEGMEVKFEDVEVVSNAHIEKLKDNK